MSNRCVRINVLPENRKVRRTMREILWNEDWHVRRENGKNGGYGEEKNVQLPHDAMIETVRSKNAWNGTRKAFFENGVWEYRKEFAAEERWKGKKVFLEFEGVYGGSLILVNGRCAGRHVNGYTEFTVDLTDFLEYQRNNEIKVVVSCDDDSRWYTGAGIYRDVHLILGDKIHIKNHGVQIRTCFAEKNRAQIMIDTCVENEQMEKGWQTVRVVNEIYNAAGKMIEKASSILTVKRGEEGKISQRISMEHPELWSTEHPVRYTCKTSIYRNETCIDRTAEQFGIRQIEIDAQRGFLLNGEILKLRGTCIHHDHGVIGARTFLDAEYRRVRKLKEAGFNAIRMAHHPAGRALLEACDELGMLVMDETFDAWRKPKTSHDYALFFEENWEADVEAMVQKDFNHPSVVMYSIGNEIPDPEYAEDAATGRKIAEKIKVLDSTRFTTNAVNGILLIMNQPAVLGAMAMAGEEEKKKTEDSEINETMASMDDMVRMAVNMPFMDAAIEEICDQVDIAGYNYMADRYEQDLKKYPHRVIVGSETYPKDICRNWRKVKELPNVIGDFTWTGWDYLGETGIGKVTYDEEANPADGFYGDYPYITAGCGDMDITGYRLPISYYREIVFGLRKAPYLAVSRPEMTGKKMNPSIWGWNDVISSWSFPGYEGTKVTVEVYADAEEVELLINGKSQGRKEIKESDECRVSFETVYEPGVTEAVAFREKKETGRYRLNSAGKEKILCMEVERDIVSVQKRELIFVEFAVRDKNGILQITENTKVEIRVDGGELLGFGNGSSQTEESYADEIHSLYRGRAIAVIRAQTVGVVTIEAKTETDVVKTEVRITA